MILGLDLGTASVGWALIDESKILDAGVHIFPEGMDRSRGEKSLNQDRRIARSSRRQTYRRARRKQKLRYLLVENSLLPQEEGKLALLYKNTNPYQLRTLALTEKLHPHEIGRALYHLGQRRGYLSNRKTGDDKDGIVKQSISEIEQNIKDQGFMTLGAYLYSLNPHQQRIRGRYTSRAMYESEFEAIWSAQSNYHKSLLNNALKTQIHDAIFFQRPLKIQKHLVGYCEFEPDRKRAAKATLIAQEFRLWSNINNLKILMSDSSERYLTDTEREIIYGKLKDKKEVKWETLKKILQLSESDRFNLEKVRKSGMLGNQAVACIQPILGKKTWQAMSFKQQEQLINDLLFIDEDRSLMRRLSTQWQLDEKAIEKLLKKSRELPKGYMHISQKAMRNIVKYLIANDSGLERGLHYSEACDKAGYEHTKIQEQRNLSFLPFPGICNKKYDEHEHSSVTTHGLRNPMVERALFQVRKVVNALIREYGKPDIIRIEMARDLKMNRQEKENFIDKQKNNEKLRQEAKKFLLEEMNISPPSKSDILKYLLWEECQHVCPYSGLTINPDQLFIHPTFEIEHIIPYSRCLDNSFMNKTLCHRDYNKRKGNQTPSEAFSGEEYKAILQRAKKLPYPKFKRFSADASKTLDEFVSQQLNETRYITVKVADYLRQLGIKIEAVKGGTTSILRYAWGMNGLLSNDGEKNRLDHRHHAIDAVITALTTPVAVKNIAKHSKQALNGNIKIIDYPAPIPNIRRQTQKIIEKIIISHKSLHKVKGALHKEFLYSLTGAVDKNDIPIVAIRKSLAKMKESDLKHIRDEKIKQLALSHLKASENYSDAFKNPENPFGMYKKNGGFQKIKTVRLIYNRSVKEIGQALSEKNDKKRTVWTMGNHHVELLEYKDKKGNTKWQGDIVSTLEATLRKSNKTDNNSVIKTDHGNDKKFIGALHQNDMVRLNHNGDIKICRVQKMDINQNIVFRDHKDAGKDLKTQIKLMVNSLKNAKPEILNVSLLGKIISSKKLYEENH